MELRQLRYFLQVADLKSFSRAALAVRLAQPALSRQIRKLEEEVGAPLFYRDGRGAILTEIGKTYYERVKGILHQLEQAQIEVQSAKDMPTGEVVLGVPPQLGPVFIAQLIRLFRARYPTARIRVAEGFSFQIADWLQSGRVDLGFVYEPQAYHHLATEMMVEEALYLVGPAGSQETAGPSCAFAALVGLPLIMPDLPSTLRARVEGVAAQAGLTVRFEIEVDSLPAIKQLVMDRAGFAIMPFAAVGDEVRRGLLSAALITDPPIARPLGLAVPVRGRFSLATQKLIALIDEEVRELMANGTWSGRILES